MAPNPKGLRYTRDGGIIIHPDAIADADTTEGSSIKIPQVDTALGAGFGDTIADADRAFAATREPVANFLTYGVASDITDKWFKIDDPDTEESDPALDRTVQDALSKLKFKARLTEALESERIYGWSLIIGGFSDVQDINKLNTPLKQGSELKQLAVYPGTKDGYKTKQVEVDRKDDNPASERFGEPVIYKLSRGSGNYLYVHYSRVCRVATRSNESSVLDTVWDDLNCGRNIRWGAAQWMYRTGGGFAVIGFPAGTTVDQLATWAGSGAFADLMARTYICIAQNSQKENDGMTFDFKGAASAVLDPTPFFKTNIEQISVATGIPQAKLVGAQAGAVTGSEVNMQDYYKVISRIQAQLEDTVRWIVDKLADSGQLTLIKTASDKDGKLKQLFSKVFGDYRHRTARTYTIEWNSAFELSSLDEATVEQRHTQANQSKLDYMTIDEVRAEENLDPLPNSEGASLKKANLNLFGEGQKGAEELETNDKYLVVDLHRKSVAKKGRFKTESTTDEISYPEISQCDEDECTAGGGHWVTIKGTHICIKEGETVETAFKRTTGKNLAEYPRRTESTSTIKNTLNQRTEKELEEAERETTGKTIYGTVKTETPIGREYNQYKQAMQNLQKVTPLLTDEEAESLTETLESRSSGLSYKIMRVNQKLEDFLDVEDIDITGNTYPIKEQLKQQGYHWTGTVWRKKTKKTYVP